MQSTAVILSLQKLDTNDTNFMKLIKFYGIEYKLLRVGQSISELDSLTDDPKNRMACLALNYSTLQVISNHKVLANDFISFALKQIPYLFVYGIHPDKTEDSAIRFITGDIIRKVSIIDSPQCQYKVSSKHKKICRQFSGLSFGPINPNIDFAFEIEDQSGLVSNLITIEDQPFFVALRRGNCDIFLISNSQIIDADQLPLQGFDVTSVFSQIVPAMLFIRCVFGKRCWHNAVNHACLIIDDPLIKERYGFLRYKQLLDAMDIYNFSTTVAFIPWNFKRTDVKIAELLMNNDYRFSICVHGCDHTLNEFGVADVDLLNRKTKLAIKRMQYHRVRTGFEYDKVMIFPQGFFSTNAMKVLKSNNFLASVNSGAVPTDAVDPPNGHCALDLAIMKYERFPLFLRRYPGDILGFAFDLFLGRPALIVVHQDWFKDEGKDLVYFIGKINLIDKNIHWRNLGDTIKRSYLIKEGSDKNVYVKMFANCAIIQNNSDDVRRYVITKPEFENALIKHVVVNGKKTSFKATNGHLNIVQKIEPKKTVNLEIFYHDLFPNTKNKADVLEAIRVWTRRHLSELRDKYLSKNEKILFITKKLHEKVFRGRGF